MANNTETQILSKLDRLEQLVIALGDLNDLAADLDRDGRFKAYSNMHNFVYSQFDTHFATFKIELIEQILPFVRDLRNMKLG